MEQLQYQLKSIRVSGMANALPERLQEARARELPHLDFLQLLVEDELTRRRDRLLERRLKAARFPERKTLDTFDFAFNSSINKQKILELHGANLIATNRPLEDWGKLLDDTAAASAILDRFLESIHLVKMSGRSYRLQSTDNLNDDKKSVARKAATS